MNGPSRSAIGYGQGLSFKDQFKTSFKVQNERDRMSFKSEMDAKELELDESRSTLQKRIKNLENQLDDEANERKKIVDQRKETEAKLQVSFYLIFFKPIFEIN